VIKIEKAHIEEVRGIRKLDIDMKQKSLAISGPNGSGKSGVIDAIEFALTGDIARLAGRGTKGLSVAEHGPHVDKVNFPDAAFVEIDVFIPSLNKSAKITRRVSAPNKPVIAPADADIKAIFEEVAEHPEITLARRDILRFILAEPAQRSEEIQAVLKLEDVGQTRAALNTAQNKLQNALKSAVQEQTNSKAALQRHLQIQDFNGAELLLAVNGRREKLGLAKIEKMEADTKLDDGIAEQAKAQGFNKEATLRDLKAAAELFGQLPELGKDAVSGILSKIATLEADPALLQALHRHSLVEKGLDLIDGPDCPLCDHRWPDEAHLKEHLHAKLAKSQEAGKMQSALLQQGAAIAAEAERISASLRTVLQTANQLQAKDFSELVSGWDKELQALKGRCTTFDGLTGLKAVLARGWAQIPTAYASGLSELEKAIQAKPDQSATVEAQSFLTTAQIRLVDYRAAQRRVTAAKEAAEIASAAYEHYCSVMEGELNELYKDVQEDFSDFYRLINEGDEAAFTAKLTPSESKLDLKVNFYERGLFPPGAYHSEGHQDGMGVCLYLALMKRLFGKSFTIALLDDVVMSVDIEHRRQFCKLLKVQFPDTQFIVTTHDRLWAEQMRHAGVVSTKNSLVFNSWSVDTGPLVESNAEIWDEIEASVAKGRVEVAAASLRRHLEYVSRILADGLAANTPFHADGNYELGELMPNVLSRFKDWLGKAASAAQSWGNDGQKDAVAKLKARLSESNAALSIEQWAVNKAVHYNEWANFGRKDFEPVVAAYKELMECFSCKVCKAWLHISPRHKPEALRCECGDINLNLNSKPK
jgi:recombinational DNA repair ATPase RecF